MNKERINDISTKNLPSNSLTLCLSFSKSETTARLPLKNCVCVYIEVTDVYATPSYASCWSRTNNHSVTSRSNSILRNSFSGEDRRIKYMSALPLSYRGILGAGCVSCTLFTLQIPFPYVGILMLGFEPKSPPRKGSMIDHYTTSASCSPMLPHEGCWFFRLLYKEHMNTPFRDSSNGIRTHILTLATLYSTVETCRIYGVQAGN